MRTSALAVAASLALGVRFAAPAYNPQRMPRELAGSWTLESRLDYSTAGTAVPVEPTLGADPVGLLVYDGAGHVAVQLMGRHREAAAQDAGAHGAANNTAYVNGYDAYFGTVVVDTSSHTVTHRLEAALTPGDVGKQLVRHYELKGDRLVLTFQATGAQGEPVHRVMTWQRVAGT